MPDPTLRAILSRHPISQFYRFCQTKPFFTIVKHVEPRHRSHARRRCQRDERRSERLCRALYVRPPQSPRSTTELLFWGNEPIFHYCVASAKRPAAIAGLSEARDCAEPFVEHPPSGRSQSTSGRHSLNYTRHPNVWYNSSTAPLRTGHARPYCGIVPITGWPPIWAYGAE